MSGEEAASCGLLIMIVRCDGLACLSTNGDYQAYESLVIRLLHDEERGQGFWSDNRLIFKSKFSRPLSLSGPLVWKVRR